MVLTTDAPERLLKSPDSMPENWRVGATSRIWDISNTSEPRQLAALPDAYVTKAVFAENRPVLATLSLDNQFMPQAAVVLWDITIPWQPQIARRVDMAPAPRSLSLAATFTRGDQILYVADPVGELTVWDVKSPSKPRRLAAITASGAELNGLASSADSRTLVTSDSDGVLTIWDISASPHPKQIIKTGRHEVSFGDAVFPGGGDVFLALTNSGRGMSLSSLSRWRLDADLSAAALCEETGPYTSRWSWETYFPAVPYQPMCT